jgi:prolyl-tRNA editing enzyme YbaK/EbsC (Cys-tRNA(Pro) deacylase)
MIQDFIEVNNIDGKIVTFPSVTILEKAATSLHLSSDCMAKSFVFSDDKLDYFIVVAKFDEIVDEKEANKLFNKTNLVSAEAKDVYRLTGFEKRYFPPIAIYGTKTVLADSVKKKNNLLFALNENEFLLISPNGILQANELIE